MRAVTREEILDYQTYDEKRDEVRLAALEAKKPRRVHVGDHFTFLFENRDTVRYQIQEMVRAERLVKEAEIRHEIDTYNELLGGDGELGATFLIEIDDPAVRKEKLAEWKDLPDHLYVRLEDGRRIGASHDRRQRTEDKVSSVQFVKFDTGGEVPVAVGIDLAGAEAEAELDAEQRRALAADLADRG